MKKRAAVWLAVGLPKRAAPPSARFQALYWPAFQEDIYALAPGGGFGDYLALAARGALLAFIRREHVAKPTAALTLYDLSSARALHTLPLDTQGWADSWQLGFWGPGSLYTLHEDLHTLTLYDQSLQETLHFAPPPGFDAACPDPQGMALWCAAYGRPALTRFPLSEGEAREVPSGLPAGWSFEGFAGALPEGGVLSVFSNDQGQSVFLAADASGSARIMPIMAGFRWMRATGRLSFATRAGDTLMMPAPGDERMLRLSDWREDEYAALVQGDLLLTEAYGAGPALRLIDLTNGQAIASLEAPAGDMPLTFSHMAISDLGYAVLADNQYELNAYSLYLWDFRQSPQAASTGAQQATISQLRAQNDAQAQEISQKYGLALHTRQDGARFFNDTYYALPLDEEPALAHALSSLDKTLSQLPPAILREAGGSPGVYLSGPIRAKAPEGLRAPGAFTAMGENGGYIALDISTPEGVRTLAHELMHLLEGRLAMSEGAQGQPMLDDWLLLCPPGTPDHGYFFSYHDEEGLEISDTRFTADAPEAWDDPGSIWFIDAYSRTFPTEDRARIFESLFLAGDTPPEALNSPRLLRKAQYLAAILREGFPSLKLAPTLPWERHITPVPYDTFRQEFEAQEHSPQAVNSHLASPIPLCYNAPAASSAALFP